MAEVREFFGAAPAQAERFRRQAARLLAPPDPAAARPRRLGPLFRRVPSAPVRRPTDPVPDDLEQILSGCYVSPERSGAAWRVVETLVAANCWGRTTADLAASALDDLDFALTSAGVPAAAGLRHLISTPPQLNLLPVAGLTVGWQPHSVARGMATTYRAAIEGLRAAEQQELVAALVNWLDGFARWAPEAQDRGRPAPDLLGFWAA